ncbi:hypothetical protein [Pseudopedobacter beijingensis]|uniref:Uncharacterized protein n=1 Tax=Pseudopedobacter beijingensis TaxID=1207056 RepID=A0ABW4IEA6_9SPHI
MECIVCKNECIKWGKSNGKQRYTDAGNVVKRVVMAIAINIPSTS